MLIHERQKISLQVFAKEEKYPKNFAKEEKLP